MKNFIQILEEDHAEREDKMVLLPKEKDVVLKADDPKYNRGLVVTLKAKGGYDLYYWYDDPKKIYPAEIKVDGTVVDDAGGIVHVGFHPELAGLIYEHTRRNPTHVSYLPQNYGSASRIEDGNMIIDDEAVDLHITVTENSDDPANGDESANGDDSNDEKSGFMPILIGLAVGLISYYS